MSLDEARSALGAFAADLARLDESLASSLATLERHHAELEPLWTDASATRYRRAWADVSGTVRDYLRREAPAYRVFVGARLRQLDTYLGHG